MHQIPASLVKTETTWGFNGNLDKPTFDPSVRHYIVNPETKEETTICHYHIVEGKMNYCNDCKHHLNGKQGIEMMEFVISDEDPKLVLVGPDKHRYGI